MPTLQLADLDLYYEELGDGPNLLFVNGSGSSIEAARPLIERFAGHFHVLVHDQRGLGRTSVPSSEPTMADYAADALALLDHVGWRTTRLVGVSFGGMVAQEIAVTAPERIERLALVCTSAGGAAGASYPLHELATLSAAERDAIGLRLVDTRFDEQWLADHPLDRAIMKNRAAGAARERTPEQRRGEAMQLEARRHHDVADRLGRITAPTLVACGAFDGIAPPANSAAINERIPGSELRTYAGGHLFVIQDPQALPDIIDFLA
jgi:3-oxoadipate enol-lactonase